jgi:hypothetical protein
MIYFVLATLISATATQLSVEERLVLKSELDEWKASAAGQAAFEYGFLPPTNIFEGLSFEEVESIELLRYRDTKRNVDELNRLYPTAQFSTENPFVLMTEEEFALYVNRSLLPVNASEWSSDNLELDASDVEATPIVGVDFSSSKCSNPVREQGRCSSCWAFASISAAEYQHCLVTGQKYDLSEQEVTSCSTNGNNRGCNGGNPTPALKYIYENGAVLESSYPYTNEGSPKTESCRSNVIHKKLRVGPPVKISGETALKQALKSQPVVALVEAANSVWKNYKSGVVTASACPGQASDHAVVAVSYGSFNGMSTYKIRNSWGPSWGIGGYIYLQAGVGGVGTCNVVQFLSYPSKPE